MDESRFPPIPGLFCPICGSMQFRRIIERRYQCDWCGVSVKFSIHNYPEDTTEEKSWYYIQLAKFARKMKGKVTNEKV